MERLQKVLAQAGIASRRKAEELIESGQVQVNGETITVLGTKVNPDVDQIMVNGQRIQLEPKVYYLFHKPTGVITSVSDPHGRKVVMDYFKDCPVRIYPVGRLDQETSGLLLLTNDGPLAHKLLHPSSELEKVYVATVRGIPSSKNLHRLAKGVKLDDGQTAPAKVEPLKMDQRGQQAIIRITIHEGRNRQVRRMFKHIGHPVLKLHREQFAFLTLDGLAPGQRRTLTTEEVNKLKHIFT